MINSGCLWAYELLRGEGFDVNQVIEEGAVEPIVEEQTPVPGTMLPYGSQVTIYCT